MITLEPHAQGVVLRVRAHPGARANGLRGEQEGELKVGVTQAPEKGKANKALIAVLCAELDLRKSQVELLSGETAPHKRFLVRGISPADLLQRIRTALG